MVGKKNNSVLYGLISGVLLMLFYISVISFFQGFDFALLNLGSLWYLIFPLAIGFGVQIGLYSSIIHSSAVNSTVAGTSGISGGSMIACCSHFLLQMIPLAGASGIAVFLVKYQAWFLVFGVLSNFAGIGFMIRHRNKMKGGNCHLEK